MSELFDRVAVLVNQFKSEGLTLHGDQGYEIYALYKQATLGDNETKRPQDEKGAHKWDRWSNRRGLSKQEARNQYVETFKMWFPAEWVAKIEVDKKIESKIQEILFGPQIGALLYTVISLRIPQFLSQGPKSIDDISNETNIDRDKLERVLLALEAHKIFNYDTNSRVFSLSEISERFLNEPFVDFIKFSLSPMNFECYSALSDSLKMDKTTPEVKYDSTLFDYLGSHPECLKDFTKGYSANIKMISDELVQHVDLRNSNKVLSIGGHTGDCLCTLSKQYPNIQGLLFEPTLFRQIIENNIKEYNVQDRVKVQPGNYIDTIPQDFDTILLECVSKEYSDENFDKILRNVRSAMSPGGKVYLLDMIMDKTHPFYKKERYMDIFVFSLLNGKVRTREEMEPFFERNGLRIKNVTPIKMDFLIEAEVV